ncbi:aldo/keto reductase [Pseudonocardia adelaidensis]|uniref:Aldo/keto reductase n=1 Tax=Pseudonocardia adelaidensis TaxID=648754 RepID=A0ABP9NKI6_9PSEU
MQYRLLGRTGLRVAPFALGAMTFGDTSWGTDETTSRAIVDRYLDAGGNFIDTANGYASGRSEEILGAVLAESGRRDEVVLATKFTAARRAGDPNAGGNGRKNILASLEESLRRLRTDYLDLYWLHIWDTVTPVEEVMSTFDALVRAGKVRAVGLSDTPAWYAAKAQLRAAAHGWEPVAALQLEYSLVERSIEREHVPAALDLGMGIVPWSPLAHGFLTGKYTRGGDDGIVGEGRVQALRASPYGRRHTERDWAVLASLVEIADELGASPAQVALSWVTSRPGVSSTLVGARTVAQLEDNLGALDVILSAEHLARLEQLGRPDLLHPYDLHVPEHTRRLHGGAVVAAG